MEVDDLTLLRKKVVELTAERDRYRDLYCESELKLTTLQATLKQNGKGSKELPLSFSGMSVENLLQKTKALESYILKLDWLDVPPPKELEYLFQKNVGTCKGNGYVYLGEIIDGKPNGKGKKMFDDGTIGEGTYIDGRGHGRLTMSSKDNDGNQTKEVHSVHGFSQGLFRLKSGNGNETVGCFVDGEIEGVSKTVEVRDNRRTYINYKQSLEHGECVIITEDEVQVCEMREGEEVAGSSKKYKRIS